MSHKPTKPLILKVNENVLKLSKLCIEMEKQIKIMKSDLECVKSYIHQQEEIKKIELSRGWFFT